MKFMSNINTDLNIQFNDCKNFSMNRTFEFEIFMDFYRAEKFNCFFFILNLKSRTRAMSHANVINKSPNDIA